MTNLNHQNLCVTANVLYQNLINANKAFALLFAQAQASELTTEAMSSEQFFDLWNNLDSVLRQFNHLSLHAKDLESIMIQMRRSQ